MFEEIVNLASVSIPFFFVLLLRCVLSFSLCIRDVLLLDIISFLSFFSLDMFDRWTLSTNVEPSHRSNLLIRSVLLFLDWLTGFVTWPISMAPSRLIRFFSRRHHHAKPSSSTTLPSKDKSSTIKNGLVCTVVLLDGEEIHFEIEVSHCRESDWHP